MKKILLSTLAVLSLMACHRDNDDTQEKVLLNEDFSSFIVDKTAQTGRIYGLLPQNNWTSPSTYPFAYVSQNAVNSDNKYISAYNMGKDEPIYIVTPELDSTKGTLTFTSQSNGQDKGKIQVGTITNPADVSTFSAVGTEIAPSETNATFTVEIKDNSNKYIAFKVLPPAGKHSFTTIDDVVFTQK